MCNALMSIALERLAIPSAPLRPFDHRPASGQTPSARNLCGGQTNAKPCKTKPMQNHAKPSQTVTEALQTHLNYAKTIQNHVKHAKLLQNHAKPVLSPPNLRIS